MQNLSLHHPPPPHGMTLIELMVAMSILAIGILGSMSALISISALETANHDDLIAVNISRQKLAEIQTQSFQTIFTFYGPNGAQNSFPVTPLPNGTGKLVFPTNAAGALDETINDTDLGMPMDLNSNGSASDTDVSTSYKLLPLRIEISWDSSVGRREFKLNTMMVQTK
ncbi:MAG: prepilin-type N-terminal cleavage/methylation domain-containing protein [Planctomycetota bacterium]